MKNLKPLLFSSLVGLSTVATAQNYPLFYSAEDIDIANIRAPHLVHGDMWHDSSYSKGVEFPKGGGKTIGLVSAIWMGGYTATSALRTAAVTYRADGSDYWPGPVNFSASTTQKLYDSSRSWAKIWKINRSEINTFLALSTHTASNTPTAILEWPAKGNPYAKGAGGASLNIPLDMAPFVDVNSDGQYNPLAGDYPSMKGSQMLWWVINDAGPTHTVSATGSFKMEIKISAYAYKLGTLADNIIFYEYDVTNRSTETYSQFRMGVMADFDIGLAFDDFVGIDSNRRLGYTYNLNPNDTTTSPPAGGIAIMELPGDSYQSYALAGSFVGYHNSPTSPAGDPSSAVEYDRMLRSQFRTGITGIFTGKYLPPYEEYSCDSPRTPDDVRFVIASNDITFGPGQSKKFAFAMVAADSTGNCRDRSFNVLHKTTDTAYKLYWNPIIPPAGTTGVATIQRTSLNMYPNPATDRLFVKTSGQSIGDLTVYDAMGRTVATPQTHTTSGFELNTSQLSPGVYTIRHQSNLGVSTGIFVKQ